MLGVNDKAQLPSSRRVCRARSRARADAGGRDAGRSRTRSTCAATSTHGSDVLLDVNVVLEGHGAPRRPRAHRAQAACFATARSARTPQVFANCVIDGARIGADCQHRAVRAPAADARARRRRAHRQLRRGQEQPTIGEGSKANHLGYVGDARGRQRRQHRRRHASPATTTAPTSGAPRSADGAFIGSGSHAGGAAYSRRRRHHRRRAPPSPATRRPAN